MRLIDADELKKCAIPCEIHNGALTDLCVPLYQIDNAPTVTPEMQNDIWANIEKLSELRSNYNCFDEKEEPYYRALSNAIQALRDKTK